MNTSEKLVRVSGLKAVTDALQKKIEDAASNGGGATQEQIAQIETNKSNIAALQVQMVSVSKEIADIHSGGGSGVTSAFISALQELFGAVAVWDSDKISNPAEKISALSAFAGSGSDSDDTDANPVSVAYNGTIATINNLKNLTVSYNGTIASVGV